MGPGMLGNSLIGSPQDGERKNLLKNGRMEEPAASDVHLTSTGSSPWFGCGRNLRAWETQGTSDLVPLL